MSLHTQLRLFDSCTSTIYSIAFALTIILAVWRVDRAWRNATLKYPPGPRGYPFIGSALELREKQWLKFEEWKKTYGDVLYLKAAGQRILVLNSLKVAADLLDRRASIYSDRPPNIVGEMTTCRGLMMAIQRYGPRSQRMRQATNENLAKIGKGEGVKKMQQREAILLTEALLEDSQSWRKHIQSSIASVLISVAYGTPPVGTTDDPMLKTVDEFMHIMLRATSPGAHIVEFAKWKREAEDWYQLYNAQFGELYSKFTTNEHKDVPNSGLAAAISENAARYRLSQQECSWLVGTLHSAGFETTSTTLTWWVLAMVAYPDTQVRAQAELDTVVGRERIPTFEDLPRLPYVRAMVREVLRWRPMGPLGIPHRVMADDSYNGMFIPAGTMVLPNVWAINHDTWLYGDDAECFDPIRHLDDNGDLKPAIPDTKNEGHVTYGFGGRVCVGRQLANSTMSLDIATILWACKFERDQAEALPTGPADCVSEGLSM
ncbi:cytochrome P450 [Auriscalpium vulgare]|uniref:Cytochrome P450 n=1 Tax=Auriscalpium vulgare TaxID=40419 RepID=A0ACB8S755_9AGAM|nr:cytochrome P450 [Auriscalpium vulgare]